MTTLDQVPFGNMEFADNPEPRCACLLLLDTSGSMKGAKIEQLNAGLRRSPSSCAPTPWPRSASRWPWSRSGRSKIVQNFVTADTFAPPALRADGDTPMGEAIVSALRD